MELTILDEQSYTTKTFEIEDENGKIYLVYYQDSLGGDIIRISDEDDDEIDIDSELGEQIRELCGI